MTELITQIKHSTQLRLSRVHKFKVKINLYHELGQYIIKTVETQQELMESFRLRHEVFNQEFRGMTGAGLDFDRFDSHFDHLIIVHSGTNKIVGAYRLSCSTFSGESYTALEFDLKELLHGDRIVLELGRACIHPDFRKGSVLSLLWRGIAEYMNLCEAQLLFGCSSLKLNTARDAALVYKFLIEQGLVTHQYRCSPTKKFTMTDFDAWFSYFTGNLDDAHLSEAKQLMPSLLTSYLRLGAKVACEPAFDEDFDCIDLLTVLRKEDLAQSLATRFHLVR
jgi:putative hemolysin